MNYCDNCKKLPNNIHEEDLGSTTTPSYSRTCVILQVRREKWSMFVDIVTVIWLCIFIIGFFSTERIANVCNILNITILIVFIADLVIIYESSSDWHIFFKKHWFDILMIIPYFRVFWIFRSFRVLRLIRIAKAAKIVKVATKFSKVIKLSKAYKLVKIGHEIYDLIRTVNGRSLQKNYSKFFSSYKFIEK